ETYNKLTNNNTDSPGTQRYHDYCAELVCKDEVAKDNTSKTKVMDLEFLDYPGGWLYHTPGTEDEKKERDILLRKLAGSDIGLVLIDGERLARSEPNYPQDYLK